MKEMKEVIFIAVVFFNSFGFFGGCVDGFFNFPDSCSYQSLVTRTNLGYMLGCEVMKPRWGVK